MRVDPQQAETFACEALALSLKDGDGHRVVAAEQDGDAVGETRYFLEDQFKVPRGVENGDVARVADGQTLQPRPVLAERRHVPRPETDAFGCELCAFARAGQPIEWDADNGEVGLGGGEIGTVQVAPQIVRAFERHGTSLTNVWKRFQPPVIARSVAT
jgi:hypothetical protein